MEALRRIGLALAIALSLSWIASPALAIRAPDAGFSIISVDAYQNLGESGDTYVIVKVNIPYATPPTDPASQTFIGRIRDSLGTEIGATALPSYSTNGYGYNTFAIHFPSPSALTWGDNITVSLEGSPTLSWTPSTPNTSTTSVNWHTSASQALSRTMLATYILAWATQLQGYWGAPYTLVTTSPAGQALSATYGTTYFLMVTPNLYSLCPNVFPTGQAVSQYAPQGYHTTAANATVSAFPFNFDAISLWLGIGIAGNTLRSIAAFVLVCFVVSPVAIVNPAWGVLLGWMMAIGLAVPGFISPILAAAAAFAAAVIAGLVFLAKGAS
jgi:hypothetical protein